MIPTFFCLVSSNQLFRDFALPNILKDFWKYPKISFDIVELFWHNFSKDSMLGIGEKS